MWKREGPIPLAKAGGLWYNKQKETSLFDGSDANQIFPPFGGKGTVTL